MKEVKILPYTKDCATSQVTQRLYSIMIAAYARTEEEIWGPNYARMSRDEFEALVANGNLIAAQKGTEWVGSVSVYALNEDTFSFGLLSVDIANKGEGIGRQLIAAAEARAIARGATSMEIEVLRLKDQELPFKRILDQWYRRLGYEWIATQDFVERKPDKSEKAKLFVNPSVFDCYRKRLK